MRFIIQRMHFLSESGYYVQSTGKMLLMFCCILLSACKDQSTADQKAVAVPQNQGCYSEICDARPKGKEPLRIVSTSVTITGTLLAIDAPVIASAVTSPNTSVADEKGFFYQWADVAKSRGVLPLYYGTPNAEAIAAQRPDLIIVAASGGDSAIKIQDQLSAIAPVWVVHYDDKSWQELALYLGKRLNLLDNAQQVISKFDANIESVKAQIELPPQPSTALVYYKNDRGANVWTHESAQGRLLQDLGFELSIVPMEARGIATQGERKDIVQVSGENFSDALIGNSLLLFSADEVLLKQVKNNKFLAHIPAIQNDEVYALGNDTFRLDYYSSSNLLNQIQEQFGRK